MKSLLDVTPEEFESKYREQGLQPRAGNHVRIPLANGLHECCAIGTLIQSTSDDDSICDMMTESGYDWHGWGNFASGFDNGFTDEVISAGLLEELMQNKKFSHGRKVGQHIAKVFPKNPG